MPGFLGCADFSPKVWWRKCMPSLMEEVYARFWWRKRMPGFMEEAYTRFYRESVCQIWWRKCMPMPGLIEEVYARFDGGSICQVLMGWSVCQFLMEEMYVMFDGGTVCQFWWTKYMPGFDGESVPGLTEETYARFWCRKCLLGGGVYARFGGGSVCQVLMEKVYARFDGRCVCQVWWSKRMLNGCRCYF